MRLISLALAAAVGLSAGVHGAARATPPSIHVYPFVTQFARDSASMAIGRLVVENVDSLAFAEMHAFERTGRFAVDSATLARMGFRPLSGLHIRVIAGPTWFAINASLPRVVTVAMTGFFEVRGAGVQVGILGATPDSGQFGR